MQDGVDDLIQEIAKQNGVAVSRDDPIMVLHTINSRLLADSSRAQQVILDSFKEELESIAYRWSGDAKEKAERILNAALTASREAMTKAMQDNAKMTAEAVRSEVDGALQQVSKATQEAKKLAIFNVVAGCMTFAAAAITFFVALT